VLIALGAVVVVVILGASLSLYAARHVVSGNNVKTLGKPDGTMKVAWALPVNDATETTEGLWGSWSTPDTMLLGRTDGIIAYSLKDGSQAWGWRVPANGTGCAMSANTVNGIGVFAYGARTSQCDQLVAFNVDTGKQIWSRPVDVKDHSVSTPPLENNPYISLDGNVMAVETPQDTFGAYDLTTGKELWHTKALTSLDDPTCLTQGTAVVGDTVYGLSSCQNLLTGAKPYVTLVGYNARTGAKTWTGDTSSVTGQDNVMLWSDPADGFLFLVNSSGTGGKNTLLSFSVPHGSGATKPASIKLSDYDNDSFEIAPHGQYSPHGYAVYGHTLYIQGATGSAAFGNSLNAIDLSTGKVLWTQSIPNYAITVVSADASGVHTIVATAGQGLYQLVTFSASNGSRAYGASIKDARVSFLAQDMLYLVGGYLVSMPAAIGAGGNPQLFALTGAKTS
jgi:hypothetical protein